MANKHKHETSSQQRKVNRAASWKRAQMRKKLHAEQNEAQHRVNLGELEALGIKREMRRKNANTNAERLETPSEALRRYRRAMERAA